MDDLELAPGMRVDRFGNLPFVAMERVEGVSIRERIAAGPRQCEDPSL